MKKIQITVFIIILVIISLNLQSINLDKFEKSNESLPDTSFSCQLTIQDTSVFGICFKDVESTLKILGDSYKLVEDSDIEFPHFSINSSDGKQTLALIHHPGAYKHSFAEFIIKYNTEEIKNRIVNTKEFVTSRNIRLGKTISEVIKIFGTCYKVEKLGINKERILYLLDDYKKSPFLKRYGLPSYHLTFEFTDGKLTKYYFGFYSP